MFDGQYETALHARKAVDTLLQVMKTVVHNSCLLESSNGAIFLESYDHALARHIRFGKWDEILAEPMYDDKDVFPATIATQHAAAGRYVKGMSRPAEQVPFKEALQNLFLLVA